MTSPIIWVNGDNLNPNARVFLENPDTPAIFVFDDNLLSQWNISFKRIVFMYECLLEMPVTIRRGNVLEEISKFMIENQADHIVTMMSPSPRFWQITEQLEKQIEHQIPVRILSENSLVDTDYHFDLKRFSRYWRKAKPYAMRYK